jgi:hypothetical protein
VSTTVCACPRKVRAKGITAIVHNGHLQGHEGLERNDPRLRLVPVQYDLVEYCANRTCEKVFKAEKASKRRNK